MPGRIMVSSLPHFDYRLPDRVKSYLIDHHRASSDELTEHLRRKFSGEYGRRKWTAFRKLVGQVRQALDDARPQSPMVSQDGERHVNKSKRKKTNEGTTDLSSESDDSENMESPTVNSLNTSIKEMYKNDKPTSYSATSVNQASTLTFKYIDDSIFPNSLNPTKSIDQTTVNIKSDIGSNNASDTYVSDNPATKKYPLMSPEKTFPSHVTTNERTASVGFGAVKRFSHSRKSRKRQRFMKLEDRDIETKFEEKSKAQVQFNKSDVTFNNIGGYKDIFIDLFELMFHFKHPDYLRKLGVDIPFGILLHGPKGSGKSLVAHAIAGELEIPMLKVSSGDIIGAMSGESEGNLRDIFELAIGSAPCMIFFDKIEEIAQKRENASKGMERRIVSQLITCMDALSKSSAQVLVIGETQYLDSVDLSLRGNGRFAKEICIRIPNEKERENILRIVCRDKRLEKDFDFASLARLTPGYVGGDLKSLCNVASFLVIRRLLKTENNIRRDLVYADFSRWMHQPENTVLSNCNLSNACMQMTDFKNALSSVQPCAKLKDFATVPNVTWDDVGALENIREELQMAILAPVQHPEMYSAFGLKKECGILLAGPPGCGKTLLAKAIANEAGINFISVKGPELLNMYVGESEKAVRDCFQRARDSSPCVIFFDEVDSLCPTRTRAENDSTSRVVNQMLAEMDGLSDRGMVFVLAATNRPDMIDRAILRPGRIGQTLHVGLPSAEDRAKILHALTRKIRGKISNSVSLDAIARDRRCNGFTGADLSELVRRATLIVFKKQLLNSGCGVVEGLDFSILPEHFEQALEELEPSVSTEDELRYKEIKKMPKHRKILKLT